MDVAVTRPKFRLVDGIVGGFLAGLVMAAVMMLGSLLVGKSALYPVALIGHAFMAFTPAPVMSGEIIIRGLLFHVATSMVVGAVFAAIVSLFPRVKNLWFWGALFGVAVWGVTQLGVLRSFNPTMNENVNQVILVFAHFVFGAILGAYIESRYKRDLMLDEKRRKEAPYKTVYRREEKVVYEKREEPEEVIP